MHKLIPLICLLGPWMGIPAASASTVPGPNDTGGGHDFDFFQGRWLVHNRHLERRLAGSHRWISFDARDDVTALPGGMGNQEHYRTNHWQGYQAMGLNMYDSQAGRWNLYWADNRNAPGRLQLPVTGNFEHQAGHFEGNDTIDGKPIRVRVLWTHPDAGHVHWEQAFSSDGGSHWETNWKMDFVRIPARASTRAPLSASRGSHA